MLGALIATVSGAHPTTPFSLNVGGLNILLPATGGNQPGVPLESITLDEQGPGGVSTMRFTYEDPTKTATLPSVGDEVSLWGFTLDEPYFSGFVSTLSTVPEFGNQGRSTVVQCVGFESLLDWSIVPTDLTYFGRPDLTGPPFAWVFVDAVQNVVAQAVGTGPLRAFLRPGLLESNQAYPIGWCVFPPGIGGAIFLQQSVTVSAGTTLREAIRELAAASGIGGFISQPDQIVATQATVDFYRGLRITLDISGAAGADDYSTLTITTSEGLKHDTDGSQVVRGVFVKGANAAGTGVLPDGTGIPGRIASISDATVDNATKLNQTAGAYLAQYRVAFRGSTRLDDAAPIAHIRPGSLLALTDSATGATGTYRITSIRKTFTGARENWTVAYGGLAPSAANLIRRLTRTTLS